MRTRSAFVALMAALGVMPASADTTTFTYQGRLNDGGIPTQGTYDFRFRLYDANDNGAQQGNTWCVDGVIVTDGLFATTVDFGVEVFDGSNRWIEIAVRSDGTPGNCAAGVYTLLSPRQPITPTPYALQTRGLFVNSTLNVGVGTETPTEKLNVKGNLLVDDGVINQYSNGLPLRTQSIFGAGLLDTFKNLTTGFPTLFQGTSSSDGSGFAQMSDKATGVITLLLEGDMDQNIGNGIAVGGIMARSVGVGGQGGDVIVANNNGSQTIEMLGGSSGGSGVMNLSLPGGQTTIRVQGNLGDAGGAIHTYGSTGGVQMAIEPDLDGSGGFFSVQRSNFANGFTVDGNKDGSGNTRVDIGGANSLAFDTNQAGNSSVILPGNAISALETLDEPGVANNHSGSVAIGGNMTTLISRTINVPANGFVLALADGDLSITHITGGDCNYLYGVSNLANAIPAELDVQTGLAGGVPSGLFDFSASSHGLFSVNTGANTFYFNAEKIFGAGSATMFDIQLTLIYFPTAYGITVSNLVGGGDGGETLTSGAIAFNDTQNVRGSLTPEEIEAEQAEAAEDNHARLERELQLMREQMAALQAHLNEVERRQATMRTSVPVAIKPLDAPNAPAEAGGSPQRADRP